MIDQRIDLASAIGVGGELMITVWDARTPDLERLAREDRGVMLRRYRHKNLVVNTGLNLIRDLLAQGASPSVIAPTHIAFGTSNTATNAAQTALIAEAARFPIALPSKSNLAVVFKHYLGTSYMNGTTIREAGLFNAGAGGVMFSRRVVSPEIAKTTSIAITWAWTITLAAT